MPFTDYGTLKTAIADWLARSDLTASIPDFVTLARQNVQDRLRLRGFDKTATGVLAAADKLAVPADWLESRVLELTVSGHQRTLELVDPTKFAQLRNNGAVGQPLGYLIHGSEILFAPDAAVGMAYLLRYFATFGATPGDGATDDLLTRYPQLLLYGSLLEAEPFLRNDERMATWIARFEASLKAASVREWNARAAGGPLRMRPAGLPPSSRHFPT